MARNLPTAKSLVVSDERELGKECTRCLPLVERFCAGGPQCCTKHPPYILWADDSGRVGNVDVQACGSSSAAVWGVRKAVES